MFRILPLLLLPLCSALELPNPSGPYQFTLNVSELIDTSRKDPWGKDAIEYRRLMISRFDPLPLNTSFCTANANIDYMSPNISAAMDGILTPFGFPAGMFSNLEQVFQVSSCRGDETWPMVLLSPGFNGTRLLSSLLAQEIASKGYTVVTVDHPFDTSVEFPDGTFAVGGNVNFSDPDSISHALDIRVRDISFVLDTLGIERNASLNASALGIGGSFGGATIAAAMVNDKRLRGGVNLDGELFGEVVTTGLSQPQPGINQSFILWGASGHNRTTEPDWGTFYEKLKSENIYERELGLLNASHITFSDLPMVVDFTGTKLPAQAQAVAGYLSGKRVLKILSDYLDDYFRFVLRGNEGEGLLSGPSKEYPEVLFLG